MLNSTKFFTKDELLQMIHDRCLQIVLVHTVLQKGFTETYKLITEDIENDIRLFDLKVMDREYMLLTSDEIKYIHKEGRLC